MANQQEKKRIEMTGQGLCPGLALGKAFKYQDILSRDFLTYTLKAKDLRREWRRIEKAVAQVSEDLKNIRRSISENYKDPDAADIFAFHQEVLEDDHVREELKKELEWERVNAEQIVRNIFRKMAGRLRASRNEQTRAKADDVDDLSRRILGILLGYDHNILEKIPPDTIVVAERLLPSDTVHIKRRHLKGIVLKEGSLHSHAAILACSFGITAIANPDQPLQVIKNGDPLLLDSIRNRVIVHPSREDLEDFKHRQKGLREHWQTILEKCPPEPVTRDGTRVRVCVNANTREDLRAAAAFGYEGVGLFRSEHLYLSSRILPDEKTIVRQLTPILEEAGGRRVTLRLLDVGGDKQLPYLYLPPERNPFLGLRGIRFLLKYREILKTQLRAFLQLSREFNIRIMVPMVTLAEEIREVREVVTQCRQEIGREQQTEIKTPQIGTMIETPAAVLHIEEIIRNADFLSIGTNDLIQYVMVAGRENIDVAGYYEKGVSTVLKLVRQVVEAADAGNTEVGICGEIAGNVNWTADLLRAGLRVFSVSPYAIPFLKKAIAGISLAS